MVCGPSKGAWASLLHREFSNRGCRWFFRMTQAAFSTAAAVEKAA